MKRFNQGRLVLVGLVVLLLVVAGTAAGAAGPVGKSATPDGYQKFLVYLANGVYNPNDPNYTAPDGMFFQKQIMHRSDAQIAEEQAKALAFFKQRFGLDSANGDVDISMFMFDPRNNYRAYVASSYPQELRSSSATTTSTAPQGPAASRRHRCSSTTNPSSRSPSPTATV